GAGFWAGVVWRRATAAGVWASFLGTLVVWGLMSAESPGAAIPALGPTVQTVLNAAGSIGLRGLSQPVQITLMLATEFGLMILISLVTTPRDMSTFGPFYARLHTPVGKEDEVRCDDGSEYPLESTDRFDQAVLHDLPESATLGMDGVLLDYRKSSRFAYQRL